MTHKPNHVYAEFILALSTPNTFFLNVRFLGNSPRRNFDPRTFLPAGASTATSRNETSCAILFVLTKRNSHHKHKPFSRNTMMTSPPTHVELNRLMSLPGDLARLEPLACPCEPQKNNTCCRDDDADTASLLSLAAGSSVSQQAAVGTSHASEVIDTSCTSKTSTGKRKRRVSIQPVPTDIQFLDDDHHANKDDLWYTLAGLNECKRDAKRLCMAVDIEDVIHEAYLVTTTLPLADTTEVQTMIQLSADFEEQRGLERLSSSYHGFCRNVAILHTKTEVFLAQASQIVTSAGNDPCALAKVYTDACKPAARFARFLAKVDESEAAQEYELSALLEP